MCSDQAVSHIAPKEIEIFMTIVLLYIYDIITSNYNENKVQYSNFHCTIDYFQRKTLKNCYCGIVIGAEKCLRLYNIFWQLIFQ